MCYPCSHCNKCGRMPQPGMCGRCGYVNEPGVAACVQCGFAFPAPPGRSSGAKAPKMPTADAHGGGASKPRKHAMHKVDDPPRAQARGCSPKLLRERRGEAS